MKTTNKKVIRNNNKKDGTYLIVSKYILHSTNLKDFDKILLMSILSDADDFNFNVATYAKRFGCERDKISRAIKRLVQAGYMKQEEKENRFNKWEYVISEYGNLKETDKEPFEEQPTQPVEPIAEQPKETIDFDIVKRIIGEVVDKHFYSMPVEIFKDYLETTKKAIDSGKIESMKIFNEQALIKSISKIYTEPVVIKLSKQDVDKMVDNKTAGLTIKETASIKLSVNEWLTINPYATEQELSTKILRLKNANRKPHVGYND